VLQNKLGEAGAAETITRAKAEFEKYGRRANDFCRVVTQRWADLVTAAKQGLVEKSDERAA
jgi:hypothetical protein